MPRRVKLYPIVRKISPFVYELDLPISNRIYSMIFIAYLTRYYVSDDLYNCIFLLPGLVEYRSELDSMLGDDERNGKR